MKRLVTIIFLAGAMASSTVDATEPVIGGPCEGCENVFVGMPQPIPSHARIAPEREPGEPMIIEGIVRTIDGEAAAGIIVYAYHTDRNGTYPKAETRHGRLRGWARTDENGHYSFDTIRPGAYPNRHNPQHIHMHVIEPGKATYWIDDIVFDDDPLLTQDARRRMLRNRGGNGLAVPRKDARGVWHVTRDITLRLNVPE